MNAPRWLHVVAWTALVLAAGYLAYRGIWRAIAYSEDLTYEFAAVQAWLRGLDAYHPEVLRTLVIQGGAPINEAAIGHPVYFPSALPLFVPLALGGWEFARSIGLFANVVAILVIAGGMIRLAGWRLPEPRALLMVAFFLAMAPLHTAIAAGQVAVLVTALVIAAMLLEQGERRGWSGIAYGLATTVKVHMGLPFLAYLLLRRRWLIAGTAGIVFALFTSVAVLRLQASGASWFSSLMDNLRWLTGPDGGGSPLPSNPERATLVNLEYLLYALSPGGDWQGLLALLLVGAAGLATVWLLRDRNAHEWLLGMALVSVLLLLVTYHRYYDAVILAIPIAWAGASLRTPEARWGVAVLACCATFLFPIQTALADLARAGRLPAWLTGGAVWDAVLLATHAWALVLMAVVMLWAAARMRARAVAGASMAVSPPEAVPTP